MKSIYKSIGELVERIDQRNIDGGVTNLIGVSIDKKFINSVANVIGTDLTKYKVIEKYDFIVDSYMRRNVYPIFLYHFCSTNSFVLYGLFAEK